MCWLRSIYNPLFLSYIEKDPIILNIRAVIKMESSATVSAIVQKQDYYPFGKTKAIVTGRINCYLKNNKEV